jgi:hypothetical protein
MQRMILKSKDLSPDQKATLEGLLGRPMGRDETISVRAIAPDFAPEWLRKSWESAERVGLDRLSAEEIDAEIEAARQARRERQTHSQQ